MIVKDFKQHLNNVSDETEIRFFFWEGQSDPKFLEILTIDTQYPEYRGVMVCFKHP